MADPKTNDIAEVSEPGSVEEVLEILRDRIGKGRLAAGQRLIETSLILELGTNRSRLREAFRHLQAEGYIRIDRNKGASVRRISQQEIAETFEILKAFGWMMIEKALDRREEESVQAVLEAMLEDVEAFRLSAATHDPYEIMAQYSRFWDDLDTIQPNAVLADLRHRLEAALYRVALTGFVRVDWELWLGRHPDMLQSILDGQRRRARNLYYQLLQDLSEAILKVGAEAVVW
jgi:DNA-binding GntR family transcriptional regulator